jgi:acetylornithine deacetylase
MHPFELTRRLVEIESITENEKQVAFFLRDFLVGSGYDVSLQEARPDRFNVLALDGTADLVFTTHIDTVPPHLPFREDDEFLYGRGCCDAKGIIAAQIEAARRLRESGEKRVGLLFVVGEERDSAGALYANERPVGSRYFVDGEPTENKLVVGTKGSLRLEVVTRGRAAHSAYPEMGETAILKLIYLLDEIVRMPLPTDPVLGPSLCNIGTIQGGTKANVIPDSARAELMFRSVEPVDKLKARLEAVVAGRADLQYRFEVPVTMLNVVEGFETAAVSFASDVPFLTNWGKPYLLGPGSILDAHTDHERISKKQLLEGVELYINLARKLLAGGLQA